MVITNEQMATPAKKINERRARGGCLQHDLHAAVWGGGGGDGGVFGGGGRGRPAAR